MVLWWLSCDAARSEFVGPLVLMFVLVGVDIKKGMKTLSLDRRLFSDCRMVHVLTRRNFH